MHVAELKTNPVLAEFHEKRRKRKDRMNSAVQAYRHRKANPPQIAHEPERPAPPKPKAYRKPVYPRDFSVHVDAWYMHLGRMVARGLINVAQISTVSSQAVMIRELKRAFYQTCPYSRVEIEGVRRNRDIVAWRSALMHLLKTQTPASLPQIGRTLGNRDHTTVLHGVRRVDASIKAGAVKEMTLVTGHTIYLRKD